MKKHLSWNILKRFSMRNEPGFTLQDVSREFPGKKTVYLAKVLAEMVSMGMLCKIARNNYHIIPLNADPETYVPDSILIAKQLMHNKEYYIGYASALKIHGISSWSDSKEYVVSTKQTKPSIRKIQGVTYQFIQHDEDRFFGFTSMWINPLEKAMVSDLEKTIVDIVTKPQLAGGIIKVGQSIFEAKAEIDQDKLFYYIDRNGNKSAKKRFLYLTELLGLNWTAEHDIMMEELGSGISLLDPATPDLGKIRKKFGLKINADPDQIKREILF
jgi:predicted transcriptional regulator of viral defense system